jgi:hypothetical protein
VVPLDEALEVAPPMPELVDVADVVVLLCPPEPVKFGQSPLVESASVQAAKPYATAKTTVEIARSLVRSAMTKTSRSRRA